MLRGYKIYNISLFSAKRANYQTFFRNFATYFIYLQMEENEEYTDDDVTLLVNRFREMLHTGEMRYIEDEDMEIIIESLIGQMDFKTATKALNYALRLFPKSLVFRLLNVRKLMMELKLESAGKELDRIEREFPPAAEIYLERAFFFKLTGADDQTFPLLKKAHRLNPEEPEINMLLAGEYVRQGMYDKGLALLKHAIDNDELIEEQLFTLSYIFEENQKYEDAVSFFHELTEAYPISKACWFALGLAYSWKRDFANAIDAYLNVTCLDEETSTAFFNIGNAYFEMEDYPQALHYYEETLRIDDQDFHAMSGIGDCYYSMNEFENALDAYHQALLLNSDTTDALLGIISILQETGRAKEAEDFIRRTVSLEPRSFELLFNILHLYDKEEQPEKLKELFQLTIEQIENKEEFLFFFTVFCCNLEDNREILPMGIELLLDYLDDEEVSLSIPYLLAAMYYMSGNYTDGKNYLSSALLINYEDSNRFLSIHPALPEIEEVRLLIERYN